MKKPLPDPDACHTMEELRDAVDQIDEILLQALARRQVFIDRAVQVMKTDGVLAAAPARATELRVRIEGLAKQAGVDPDLAWKIWGLLVEKTIDTAKDARGQG